MTILYINFPIIIFPHKYGLLLITVFIALLLNTTEFIILLIQLPL